MQIITPAEVTKLRDLIREATDKTTNVIREGFESGASQDGHHDEGYQLSKRQGAVADRRATELHAILNSAKIVTPVEQSAEVRLGNVVHLHMGNERRAITICGYAGVYQTSGFVSVASPLGRALLGKKVGDSVEADLPQGRVEIEVLEIFPPSAAKTDN
jgi:transcription elongation factor GreA